MRFLLAFCLIISAASAETLDGLKKQFPTHVAGPVTAKSDPAVVQCFEKYRVRVMKLEMQGLPQSIQRLKDQAAEEVREIEWRLEEPRTRVKSSTRAAEGQNRDWIKLRLIPYLKRIEQFQRGR